VIVGFHALAHHRGAVAMVDGCFDPLHPGHIAYFAAAADLGWPLLCNIAPDSYLRTKHAPLLPQQDRAVVLDAIRYISFVHPSAVSTGEVLEELRPRAYVKGADWAGVVPADQVDICGRLGIEIVLLDTVRDSSRRILQRFLEDSSQSG
jgi:cytidyltransferase-like protein